MKTCPECRGWCELDINLSKSIECPVCKGIGHIKEHIYIDVDRVAEQLTKDRMEYMGLTLNKKLWTVVEKKIYEELVKDFVELLKGMEE